MGKINRSISIDEELNKKFEKQCKKEKRAFSNYVEVLIESHLNEVN